MIYIVASRGRIFLAEQISVLKAYKNYLAIYLPVMRESGRALEISDIIPLEEVWGGGILNPDKCEIETFSHELIGGVSPHWVMFVLNQSRWADIGYWSFPFYRYENLYEDYNINPLDRQRMLNWWTSSKPFQ